MYKKLIIAIVAVQLMISCSENKPQKESLVVMQKPDSIPVATAISFKDVVFDSPDDLTCGMPVTAGVTDSAHYKGKVYGFCAKECKDEFKKNPEAYLVKK